jgi:hypothetical protein
MHQLGKKILLLMAIWLLTGGLAFADSFDLTDELQHALFDRACALETSVDEVRESTGDSIPSLTMRGTGLALRGAFTKRPSSNLLVLALLQPLPEVLKTFRI